MRWSRRAIACFILATVAILLLNSVRTSQASTFKTPVPPVHLVSTGAYKDFGTVWARIRGSDGTEMDCGFSRWDGDAAKGRMFFGAEHPTKPKARFLKLWSPEEGALLRAIHEAVADSISEDDWAIYLRATSVYDLRSTALNGLWHLVRALDFREQFYDAVQAGHLASTESALRYSGLSGRLDIRSIRIERPGDMFEVSIQDSLGKILTILSHGREDKLCLWTFTRRMSPEIRVIGGGGHIDSRYALTLLESALHDPLIGERELRVRFRPASDGVDRLELLDEAMQHCKKWFLDHDRAVGNAP